MTLDEAIQFCEAQSSTAWPAEAFTQREYAQVAEWLRELGERREKEADNNACTD